MIGRTNVGGGGRNFTATLQITTDPNAVITAVNLAGDTFSGTANASGLLNLNVSQPGTYTVTETGGGVESIVVSDYGATYSLSVFFFGGYFIRNGLYTTYDMDELGIWSGGGGVVANLTVTQGVGLIVGTESYTCALLSTDSGNTSQCCLVSHLPIDLTDYSILTMTGYNPEAMTFGAGIFTRVSEPYASATLVNGTSSIAPYQMNTVSLDVSSLTGQYYVGAFMGRASEPRTTDFYIKDLYLE